MKASASGLYIQRGDSYVPVSAANLSADQLVRAAADGTLSQNQIDAKGTYKLVPFGSEALDLANQINVAKKTTVVDPAMTPARQVELFMLKQTTAPKLVELATQLEEIVKTNPKAQPLLDAVIGDLYNTHNVGIHAETGYTPTTDKTSSTTRTLNIVQDRVSKRARNLQTLQSAMQRNRYQSGVVPGVGRALRTGGVVGGTSWALQQLLGATTGTYLGE
jgi:hypothetical protein